MQSQALTGGFADAPTDSAIAFREIMQVMARPGRIARIGGATPPAPLSIAAGTLVLTLCDPDTPVYLAPGHDTPPIRDWITFHTGAPFTDQAHAAFALGDWGALSGQAFSVGTPEYPDRSTTLIVEMPELTSEGPTLRGPGIRDTAQLSLPELDRFRENAALFPLGNDFFFTAGRHVAALPRSTRVS
ncbi:Alpha-D-ribose 1-methylphosphonate 5-triphosphate synthase subunit PhnH [Sulfitobacter sp. THAF37]|uniref:phosphonate C-P lyase system protein PhnH n=1 Tax=Sulfitobacter sp. THAF37 TaxID=2587855 RepID=UPI0012687F2F|nr:phosphonate C-P lyase system protein PhnH [Sulfitobacter sp. THAF37]QFT58841.1 Alpha-D-ribose 1-methylphosphonate 5-triphosphate synthase subunit PhnH [Sulfitobacter sp. THAF37]